MLCVLDVFCRLFHFGLAMFLAATASTGEPALIGGVGTTLALSVALHKFVVVDGMYFARCTLICFCVRSARPKQKHWPKASASHSLQYQTVTTCFIFIRLTLHPQTLSNSHTKQNILTSRMIVCLQACIKMACLAWLSLSTHSMKSMIRLGRV